MRLLRLALAACCLGGTANAAEPVIDRFRLANGMEVIVIENHRVPAVSHMLWFRVGAIDDPEGKSGLAHYHEHMMFDGTAHYKKGAYADLISRHGGQENAFTGQDATAYYVNIAREYLPLAMELEADRLRGLEITDADALLERDIIIEERRERIENNPGALFAEQMRAALFLNHPYRLPVIGWKHEMEGLTKDDVLALHRGWYHPGNATLIVSGDITAAELKPLAEKYYGDIPAGPAHTRAWKTEPPQRAPRRIAMTHPNVQQPQWQRIYLAASVNDEKAQVPALFVLEHVLGGGKTSRLYQALVAKQKLAAAISADYNGLTLGPAEFSLSAVPAGDVPVATLETAVEAEIARLLKDGITAQELARAKTLLKADGVYSREGLQSMAYLLGWMRMVGLDVEYYIHWNDTVDRVTAQDVLAAAKAAFQPERSVTGVLLPGKEAAHAQ